MKRTPLRRKSLKPRVAALGLKKKKKKTIGQLQKQLWELCKQIIRKEYSNTCYTCGAIGLEGSNWHTGHFISKSVCSAPLAYDLDNLRPQCYRCNINLSGNWPAFELHLALDKGKDFPELLKKRNQETKGKSYGSFWYLEKIADYQEFLKEETN